MTYLVSNLSFPLSEAEPDFTRAAMRSMHCGAADITGIAVYKRSVDARKKENIRLTYTLAVQLREGVQPAQSSYIHELKEELPEVCRGSQKSAHRPVIVGFGPAGIFSGLLLARAGYRPIILEQGAPMEERVGDVEAFWKCGVLNPESNIQFGEGGAGTFSDGKLMTRINDPYCRYVLDEFVKAGAPQEILTFAKPHIGTDLLRQVVVALRREITALGGEVRFHTKAERFITQNGRISAIKTGDGTIPCETMILAIGNGARSTYEACLKDGLSVSAKPFSVGVRIEHLQSLIDEALYGRFAGHPMLGSGEYQLSQRDAATGQAVYTFCMCPGGVVVAAASEPDSIVTNGMSYHARAGLNANAALVASVDGRDFGTKPLDGMFFQRELERKAFTLTGSYRAPMQTAGEFLSGIPGAFLNRVQPTYAIGTAASDFSRLFPEAITERLKAGIRLFGRRLPGFDAADAVLTGPETRTSAPVRIDRDESRQSVSVGGVYPCGEGSGYAGGIMSSAVDGIHAALAIMQKFAPID